MQQVSDTILSPARAERNYPFRLPFLLIAAVVPSAFEWYRHAPTYFSYQKGPYAEHSARAPWLVVQIAGARVPLFITGMALQRKKGASLN